MGHGAALEDIPRDTGIQVRPGLRISRTWRSKLWSLVLSNKTPSAVCCSQLWERRGDPSSRISPGLLPKEAHVTCKRLVSCCWPCYSASEKGAEQEP